MMMMMMQLPSLGSLIMAASMAAAQRHSAPWVKAFVLLLQLCHEES